MKYKIAKFSIYLMTFLTLSLVCISYFIPSINVWKNLSFLASLAQTLVLLYCKYFWKIKILNFMKIKNLDGKWKCVFEYTHSKGSGKKETVISIKQDLFGMQINMISDETISCSATASIEENRGRNYLIYTYKTETKKQYREDNRDQWGTAKLLIKDEDNMEGEYWTNNETNGSMKLIKVQKENNR